MSTQTRVRVTPQEYLALERQSETRSEYFDGEMLPMPGVSLEHGRIVINLIIELASQFQDRPAEVHADFGVKASQTGSYFYPDICVFAGEPELEDEHRDRLLNPRVIFEVLSPSTESYDRGQSSLTIERSSPSTNLSSFPRQSLALSAISGRTVRIGCIRRLRILRVRWNLPPSHAASLFRVSIEGSISKERRRVRPPS